MRWVVVVVAVLVLGAADARAEVRPFGHHCVPHLGLRLCATTALDQRVPSWDGVPLDVDVTLPPTGDGPFPTIAMLHRFAGSKHDTMTTNPDGGDRFYNVPYAKHGYATVNLSIRAQGDSCGTPASRTPDCTRG